MRNVGIVELCTTLAGCKYSSADIAPAYVSPVAYQSYHRPVVGARSSGGIDQSRDIVGRTRQSAHEGRARNDGGGRRLELRENH